MLLGLGNASCLDTTLGQCREQAGQSYDLAGNAIAPP